jgi:ribosome-binding protein aMBF1 (putative translation factor)
MIHPFENLPSTLASSSRLRLTFPAKNSPTRKNVLQTSTSVLQSARWVTMDAPIPSEILERLTTFGELLRCHRRRVGLTQTELSIAVGYSDAQISRLEQNARLPNLASVQARFLPALRLKKKRPTLVKGCWNSRSRRSSTRRTPIRRRDSL